MPADDLATRLAATRNWERRERHQVPAVGYWSCPWWWC